MATKDASAGPDGTPTDPIQVESEDHLDQLVAQYDVVFADFYADWCGPCLVMDDFVEAMAAQTDAVVAKIDVDDLQQLAANYGVRSIPTSVLFSDGETAERLVGLQEEQRLFDLVAQYGA